MVGDVLSKTLQFSSVTPMERRRARFEEFLKMLRTLAIDSQVWTGKKIADDLQVGGVCDELDVRFGNGCPASSGSHRQVWSPHPRNCE